MDGTKIISSASDKENILYIWDVIDGNSVEIKTGHSRAVQKIAIDANPMQ